MKSFMKVDYKKFNNQNIKRILSKFWDYKNIKILYLSVYKTNYTRTETILELFKNNKIKYKSILLGESKFKYFKIIYKLMKYQRDYDIIFVAFRGHEIMPFIKLFTKKPLIFDAFVSVYDTLCNDRKIIKTSSWVGKLLKKYDSFLCKISDVCLVDTKTHKEYFEKEFNAQNIDYLYIDSNTELFKSIKIKRKKTPDKIILWYGNVLPLQGIDIILKAIKLLEHKLNLKFRLIGPVRKKYFLLIKKLNLKNIEFIDYIPYEKLPYEIIKSDLCLGGHFSNIEKAKRVIPGKVFQFLSCKRMTILGDNPANREIFKESSLTKFVKMNDSRSLANKIVEVLK